MRRCTEEEEAWLRGRFATEHIGALLDGFEREFGRRPTQRAMEQKCFKLGLRKRPRDVPARAVRPVRWCREPEMQAWMEAHDRGQSLTVLSAEFGATQRNQRRCPGCIAKRPTWGVGKQKGKDG